MKARLKQLFSTASAVALQPISAAAQQARSRMWARRCALALFAAYLLLGTFGRFPWKADEPYSFSIVWNMLVNGHWLVPHVGGDPFLEKPPLMFWLGALCARLLPWLAAHEASRLAVVVCLAVALWAFCRACARLYAETRDCAARPPERLSFPSLAAWRMVALSLLVGTVGLAEHIHKFTADLGQLAGATLALGALVCSCPRGAAVTRRQARHQAVRQGVMLGVGAGVALLSKGLLIPGIVGLTCLMCRWLLPGWSRAVGRPFYLAAGVAALPFILPWPWALYHAGPALFDEWFWVNNVGRFTGATALGGNDNPLRDRLAAVLITGAPASLFVLVALVGLAGRIGRAGAGGLTPVRVLARRHPAYSVTAIFATVFLLVLGSSGSMRDIYLLPAYPALVLLALPWAVRFELGSATGITGRAGVGIRVRRLWECLIGLALLLLVITWAQLQNGGEPSLLLQLWPGIGRQLPVPFDLPRRWTSLLLAAAMVACWWGAIRVRCGVGAVQSWACGLAVVWAVLFALLMPWVDAARSYHETFRPLTLHLAPANCLATAGLGESELGMLHYVTGRQGVRIFSGWSGDGDNVTLNPHALGCDLLLVHDAWRQSPPAFDQYRQVEWRGRRPADENGFTLYRREASADKSDVAFKRREGPTT